ncbi:MAG: hypothetical protein PHQ12_00020 [Chthoniobacteraceae bacterium]|nr:hypothetical protein [Chthoniobacteraceae bacterium]
MKHSSSVAGVLTLAALLHASGCTASAQSAFGTQERSEAALIGTFYDLKQTQQRQATRVSPKDYPVIVEEFISNRWDESVLNRYFRSGRSLYTTQIFIPVMNADNAPKAFELGNVVKPSAWIAHYKGQVSPPADGMYRFIGMADDLLAVAVDDQTVLVAALFPTPSWAPPADAVQHHNCVGQRPYVYGNWINLKKNQIINLDIIVGERPGGQFCAFLCYERQGAAYPMKGQFPILPLFQLAPVAVPALSTNLAPPVSKVGETWIGKQ